MMLAYDETTCNVHLAVFFLPKLHINSRTSQRTQTSNALIQTNDSECWPVLTSSKPVAVLYGRVVRSFKTVISLRPHFAHALIQANDSCSWQRSIVSLYLLASTLTLDP